MSEADYLKCACANCGGHIEYPPEAVGLSLPCPHCGLKTVLGRAVARLRTGSGAEIVAVGEPSQARGKGRGRIGLILATLVVAACLGGGAFWVYQRRAHHPEVALPKPAAARPPLKPKSLEDLKATDIRIERTGGSGLVYAVGDLRNDSDHQRFGVKIELELVNSQGGKVGTATDYLQLIEARAVWHFRALVLEPKAAGARVGRIQEAE